MTLAVKHAFVTAKSDGVDNTLVQPSNWNASHAITTAANVVIGCDGTGPGSAQELACTAQGRSILAAADLAAFLTAIGAGVFTTGDVKFSIKTAADTGWVLMNDGTIGSAASNATRANADTQSLFNLLYVATDTIAPLKTSGGVATTRGAQGSAAAAFAANCQIQLLVSVGKALANVAGGTANIGLAFGAASYQIAANDLPLHAHALTDPGHAHTLGDNAGTLSNAVKDGGGTLRVPPSGSVSDTSIRTNSVGLVIDRALSGGTNSTGISVGNNTSLNSAISLSQPTIYLTTMMKL